LKLKCRKVLVVNQVVKYITLPA